MSVLGADRTLTHPCQCAGACSVAVVTYWEPDADEHPQFAVSLYEHVQCQTRWRDRLRVAWGVLRGREPYTHGLILSREQAHELGEFLKGGGR